MTEPIPGDPTALHAAADALADAAARLRTVQDGVLARATAVETAWSGAALAVARLRHDGDAIGRGAEACRAAVDPLHAYADELRRAQTDWIEAAGPAAGVAGDIETSDGVAVMDSASERAQEATVVAAGSLDAARSRLDGFGPPPATAPQVAGFDGTFGDGLYKAGKDAVGGFGSLIGGAVDRVNPWGDRFGSAWSGTWNTITTALSEPGATAKGVVDGVVEPVKESYRSGGADEAIGRGFGELLGVVGDKGLGGLSKIDKIGAATRATKLRDPDPGLHTPIDRGEHTPITPGGGLQAHENAGGHTLDPAKAHVGATPEQILARQSAGGVGRVSSFSDRATAESSVRENVAGNAEAIRRWLQSPSPHPQHFDWNHGRTIGVSAPPAATLHDITPVSGSRVVLIRAPDMPDGYRIVTSFPKP